MRSAHQKLVDETFQVRLGVCGYYHDEADVARIRQALRQQRDASISFAEAVDFWRWRSSEWDASWLTPSDDSEVLEWFDKFLKFVGVETDEDNETQPEQPPRVGVKVPVKDADGELWEIELEPDYHKQLLAELELQTPENSPGGTIRYTLEYDPDKVWGMRKLDGKST